MKTNYPTIDRKKTGQRIKEYMLMESLTAEDVRQFLGLGSVQSVYHWLEGKSLPSLDNLYALSQLFDVIVDDIICGDREKRRFPWETTDPQGIRVSYYQLCLQCAHAA